MYPLTGWQPSPTDVTMSVVRPYTDDPIGETMSITGPEVRLYRYMKLANGGVMPPTNWQLTGSCVKGGAANAIQALLSIESVVYNQGETFQMPCTFGAYARSREMIGMTTEGEGSSGDTMAKAMNEVGIQTFKTSPVKYQICGPAYVASRQEELQYSAWRNIPESMRQEMRPHVIEYMNVPNADAAEARLRKGEPLTFAGNWGGDMRPPRKGAVRPVLLSSHNDTWNHQESVLAVWLHPDLGRIFLVLNQWFGQGTCQVETIRTREGPMIARIVKPGIAVSVHGDPTEDEPPGSFWITDKDMDYQCRTGEVRAVRNLRGFKDGLLSLSNV